MIYSFIICDNFAISIIKEKIYIIGCSGGKVDICKMAYIYISLPELE